MDGAFVAFPVVLGPKGQLAILIGAGVRSGVSKYVLPAKL